MALHLLDPSPSAGGRFQSEGELVRDHATGLVWPRSASVLPYPLPWAEALAAVADLNREGFLGHADWRMPNRRELRSLVHHAAKQPALAPGHPFRDVFLGWYWTSTTKAAQPAYAWNVHLEGGRMFFSRKDEFRLLWPVRGQSALLPRTGQLACFDATGREISCVGSGQDGDLCAGAAWPLPRFLRTDQGVEDRLTGLCWLPPELVPTQLVTWREAQEFAARQINGWAGWRLPDINELESLVDAGRANPALPPELTPFPPLEGLWSATVSGFDPAWAFVLYVQKGAVGVGFQAGREFQAWPVRGA